RIEEAGLQPLPHRLVDGARLAPRLLQALAHGSAEGRVVELLAGHAHRREALVEQAVRGQQVEGGQELAPTEVAPRAQDHHGAGARLAPRGEPGPGDGRRAGGHAFFVAWPPNSLRSAATTLAAKESC